MLIKDETSDHLIMSILNIRNRPWAVFDATNPEHRAWYHQYAQTGSWAACPYQLIVEDDHGGDVTHLVERELSRWYAAQEFGCNRKG